MANPTAETAIDSPVDVSSLGITNSTDKATLYDYHARSGKFIVRWLDSEKKPQFADLAASQISLAT